MTCACAIAEITTHRRGTWGAGALAATLIALLGAPLLAAGDVPFLAGRVNDYAHAIPQPVASRIETKLGELETRTGAQVAILIIDSLAGEDLEDYSVKVAQTWKLGHKGKDDGVLVLVAITDRKMRIEVGYGLEARITDAASSRIINNIMRPRFKQGDFGAGLEAAVDAISATLQGQATAIPAEAPSQAQDIASAPLGVRLAALAVFVVVIGLFSTLAVLGPGCQSWFLYVFLMPFYLAFPVALLTPPVGIAVFVVWVVAFPIAKTWLGRTPAGKAFLTRHPGWVKLASSSGSGRSSGSGWSPGGGGFSGGGGSFGGGGASGSW